MTRTPLSRSKGQLAGGGGILWRPPAQLVTEARQSTDRDYVDEDEFSPGAHNTHTAMLRIRVRETSPAQPQYAHLRPSATLTIVIIIIIASSAAAAAHRAGHVG